MTKSEEVTEVVIIGGGPGGLACAGRLAEKGKKVTLIERKSCIGTKVCAGGITWSGLLQNVPEHLVEKTFAVQHVFSPHQHAIIKEKNPIVATVNREKLGQWMVQQATDAGAIILNQTKAVNITSDAVTIINKDGKKQKIRFQYLVGADGANSLVRRYLGLQSNKVGLGIQATLPLQREDMEWHLAPQFFGSGYGWIFPHADSISIGCYIEKGRIDSRELKNNLVEWAKTRNIHIPSQLITGGLVNYDYQGYRFDNCFLVGEAAGLASGLTGEGIYPAIVSGKTVADMLCDPQIETGDIEKMIKKQQIHQQILRQSQKSSFIRKVVMELTVFLLKIKALRFHMLEMAD